MNCFVHFCFFSRDCLRQSIWRIEFMAQVRSARAINRAEKTKIARYLLYLLVQIKMERFQFRRNCCKWLTRVKSWVQEHFFGFQWKLDFELSKFQNVRLRSVVLNNANLYEEKGSSAQSFLQGTVIQCCKNNFIRREFSSNTRNLEDITCFFVESANC